MLGVLRPLVPSLLAGSPLPGPALARPADWPCLLLLLLLESSRLRMAGWLLLAPSGMAEFRR
jgi:hypothetical protein